MVERATEATEIGRGTAHSVPRADGPALAKQARELNTEGRFEEARATMERAYAALLEAGDTLAAVRAATFLATMTGGSGEVAASHGWEQRALRLLDAAPPCIERGYLALARPGCDYFDPGDVLARAELAYALAEQFHDRDLQTRALAEKGLALVSQGSVHEGFALLDEAMIAAAAGEINDPVQLTLTVCAMNTACERTGDVGRAEYWCSRIEREPRLHHYPWRLTHCALVYGSVDALRGRWDTAEVRLQQALSATATNLHLRATCAARLAELRIFQGRYDDAAELLRDWEHDLTAAPAVARLRLAQGRLEEAASLLRTLIRSYASDSIRLAPALALLVDVELRRGATEAAEKASQRLLALEERCGCNDIRALARLSSARIAVHRGDPGTALDELDTALTLLIHIDRPLLTAQVRLELARALVASADTGSARVEAEAALAAFDARGAVAEVAACNQVLASIPRRAAEGGLRAPAGGTEALTPREQEVAALVTQGLANREIAQRLFLSVRTVETHVDRVLGKLGFNSRSQLIASAQTQRALTANRVPLHGA